MQPASLESVSTSTAVLLAFVSTLALAALHLLAPHIRKLTLVPESVTVSFGAGAAISYVFLHLLPELARGNTVLREVFGEDSAPPPLTELGIFIVALLGFCLFYGLERLAEKSAGGRYEADRGSLVAAGNSKRAPAGDHVDQIRRRRPKEVFWTHLAAYGLYNFVITYTLPLTYRTGVAFAVLFTIAMGLHFVLSDRGLVEHYGEQFDRLPPRLILVGALVVGWGAATFFAPTSSVTVSVLLAFLAGSVLFNVFKEEFPSAARRSSFPWFLTGLLLYAALLFAVTLLGS
jgi:zinc transporter ZupT